MINMTEKLIGELKTAGKNIIVLAVLCSAFFLLWKFFGQCIAFVALAIFVIFSWLHSLFSDKDMIKTMEAPKLAFVILCSIFVVLIALCLVYISCAEIP